MKKLFFYISMTALSAVSVAAPIPALNELIDQWISIESQKGQLERNWLAQKQHLQQKSKLLEIEKSALSKILQQTKVSKSDVDGKRLNLIQQQTRLEQENNAVKSKVLEVSELAYSLLPQLPPPLQIQWQDKLLILRQESASSSEKLERLLTLFKLVNEFDERIAINRTSMKIPNNKGETQNLLVTQIYLGISQAWYISDDGQTYGFGRTKKLAWSWFHNKAADKELGYALTPTDLLNLTDMINNPTKATYMSLPIKLKAKKDIS